MSFHCGDDGRITGLSISEDGEGHIVDDAWRTLLVNAVAHLLVDGVCAATLFGRLGGVPNLSALVMLYSTLAFSTQSFVGLTADRVKRHALADSVAMIVVAVGYLLPLQPLFRVLIVGVGNSVFHVAGGAMTLEHSGGKAGSLGIFVAPGAVGLSAGTLWPVAGTPMAVALMICAVGLAIMDRNRIAATERCAPGRTARPSLTAIVLLTLSVAVRAIGGTAVRFAWNTTGSMAILLALSVFAGKTAGGLMCDGMGVKRLAWISLAPAALLIAFCSKWMVPSLLGQFLLNMTMPVTLWLLYLAMPDSPGFAFGLAASALWPGTLAGRMMAGRALWPCLLISIAFGLVAILCSEKRIPDRTGRILKR